MKLKPAGGFDISRLHGRKRVRVNPQIVRLQILLTNDYFSVSFNFSSKHTYF